MKVAVLTREYPPDVYGGAGVHVQHLVASLADLIDVQVQCFGTARPSTARLEIVAHQPWERLEGEAAHLGVLRAMSVDLSMVAAIEGVDLVHSHTWYANFAGHLAKMLGDVPHVMTVHSLEPRRPWKADQLGTGYRLSTWCEDIGLRSADAIIAVSRAVAADICACYPATDPDRIAVVHNGVDADEFYPDPSTDVLDRYGIDADRPMVVCVGRVTRQKGILHLLDAARQLDPVAQLVMRVGPADTPELATEVGDRIAALADERDGVFWIPDSLDRTSLVQLLSHATVACCPSVYEPFGLVNAEAMACGTAVVASAVGGIPEIVEHGVTGLLVPFEPVSDADPEPAHPARFASDLGAAIDQLVADPRMARTMGQAGRRRVIEQFSWPAIAARTAALYRTLLP